MRPIFFISLLGLLLVFSGCMNCVTGEGTPQEEIRITQNFSTLNVECSADVVLKVCQPGEQNRVVIIAQPNLLQLITTKVSGNTLLINMEGCITFSEPVQILVYSPEINRIVQDGSGNISSEGTLMSEKFEIEHDGSGSLNIGLKTNDLDVEMNGSGSVFLTGNTNEITINHNSSGSCDALNMQSIDAEVNLDGSGDVQVYANGSMELNLNGSGSITYGGNPEKLNTQKDGSGEIHQSK